MEIKMNVALNESEIEKILAFYYAQTMPDHLVSVTDFVYNIQENDYSFTLITEIPQEEVTPQTYMD